MRSALTEIAGDIMHILSNIPGVDNCALYGSLASGKQDALSDIDIEIHVSSLDNGIFALELPEILGARMNVYYADYAPSLAPEKYVVSVAIDETDPFRMVDICVTGTPHFTTVTRQQLSAANDPFAHMLKLWTANLKHHARGADCRGDILKMGRRLGIADSKSSDEILADVLGWLETNAPDKLKNYVASCRKHFDRIIKQ